MLAVVGAATVGLVPDVSVLSGALQAVLGAVGGLIVAAVGAMLRNRRASDGDGAGPEIPAPWGPMWASLRSFDEHTRDGVRRAIPLAIGMFIYQRTLDHDSLWVFLAAFAVLLPTGKTAFRVAAARVISTVVGVLVLSVLGLVGAAGAGVLFAAAILFVLVGIAYKPTYPLQAGALSAMGAVLLVAGPAGNLGAWAGHRLLDTLLGCAMAVASTYLLWPRDKPDDDVVTVDEEGDPRPSERQPRTAGRPENPVPKGYHELSSSGPQRTSVRAHTHQDGTTTVHEKRTIETRPPG